MDNKRFWAYYWKKKGHVSKKLVENCRALDITKAYLEVMAKAPIPNCDPWRLEIQIGNALCYADVTKTKCNFGGYRYWFLCPICRKRAKKLYFNADYFLCRKCLNLSYSSQRKSYLERCRHMEKCIEKKLEDKGGSISKKPKGLHKKTFDELRSKHWKYFMKADQYIGKLEDKGLAYSLEVIKYFTFI